MRLKTIQVYKFEELKEDVKQKVLDKHREINVEYEWFDYILEEIAEDIKSKLKLNLDSKDIEFNLGHRENAIHILSNNVVIALSEKYPKLIGFDLPNKFGCYKNYLGGGLCGGLTHSEIDKKEITIEEVEENGIEEDVEKLKNEETKDKICKDLEKLHKILGNGFNRLTNTYFDLMTNDSIKETLEINEHEFDIDGNGI